MGFVSWAYNNQNAYNARLELNDCVPTCCAMAFTGVTSILITPDELVRRKLAFLHLTKDPDTGTSFGVAQAILTPLGVNCHAVYYDTMAELKTEVDAGRPPIICVAHPLIWSGTAPKLTHAVVLVGYEGYIWYVNDPASGQKLRIKESDLWALIQKCSGNAVFLRSAMPVVETVLKVKVVATDGLHVRRGRGEGEDNLGLIPYNTAVDVYWSGESKTVGAYKWWQFMGWTGRVPKTDAERKMPGGYVAGKFLSIG